jgi:DNA transformation protein
MVSEGFREFTLEQLGRVAPAIRSRRMFGGVGVYSSDRFFALLDDDILYLKADDVTRPEFVAAGMPPFQPGGEGGETMSYYAVPPDLLEDAEALEPWVTRALDAATRKRTRPRRSR